MMKSSTLFERGPLPPYVHLASTRRHSRDRCSQAFPIFCALPLPCILLNKNRRTKNGGGLGTRLRLMYTSASVPPVMCQNNVWQSQVEIEHYSVVYFDRIAVHSSAELPLGVGLICAV